MNRYTELADELDAVAANVWGSAKVREAAALLRTMGQAKKIHQWRMPYCADWYDGFPDPRYDKGPFEKRTLYAIPPDQSARIVALEALVQQAVEALDEAVKALTVDAGGKRVYPGSREKALMLADPALAAIRKSQGADHG